MTSFFLFRVADAQFVQRKLAASATLGHGVPLCTNGLEFGHTPHFIPLMF